MDREIAGPWMFGPGDHVVEPGTRVELFRGRLIWVPPSRPGRADIVSRVSKVIGYHEADGYVTSIDLLTRRSYDNDFATAICVRRVGRNPATGHRYLEELAFEIFFEQPREYACDRAYDVVKYGVRRMFGIFGTERWPGSDDDGEADYTVAEWRAGTHGGEPDAWWRVGARGGQPAKPGPRTLWRTPRTDAGQHVRESTALAHRGPASTAARVLAGIRPRRPRPAATLSPDSRDTHAGGRSAAERR